LQMRTAKKEKISQNKEKWEKQFQK
jgi:hypothetical protein